MQNIFGRLHFKYFLKTFLDIQKYCKTHVTFCHSMAQHKRCVLFCPQYWDLPMISNTDLVVSLDDLFDMTFYYTFKKMLIVTIWAWILLLVVYLSLDHHGAHLLHLGLLGAEVVSEEVVNSMLRHLLELAGLTSSSRKALKASCGAWRRTDKLACCCYGVLYTTDGWQRHLWLTPTATAKEPPMPQIL